MTFKQCFDTSCVSAGRAKIARAFVKITFRENLLSHTSFCLRAKMTTANNGTMTVVSLQRCILLFISYLNAD